MSTAADFERDYCARSGITVEEFRARRKVVPCECGADGCEGWAAVPKDFTDWRF